VEVFDANRHFGVQYPHRHDFYELLFLSKGSGYHNIDENQYEVKPPCVFFLSPGQAHSITLSSDIEGYIFLFTSEFYLLNQKNKERLLEFPFFFSTDRNNPPLLLDDPGDVCFLQQLFTRACGEVAPEHTTDDTILCSILDLLLLTCNSIYPRPLSTMSRSKSNIMVKNYLLLIEENYQDNLRVSEYAAKLGVTPNHLSQMVKQVTGKTAVALLHDKILVEVKRLLIHTTLSIAEIAEIMHFDDQSYFTKFFKKTAGMAPMAYRKENARNNAI